MVQRKREYTEAEFIDVFKLTRIVEYKTALMQEWLTVTEPVFDIFEQRTFDTTINQAIKNIFGWSEEDLKMKFISDILPLGHLVDNGRFYTYFEKIVSGQIDNIKLRVKTDFMVAAGVVDVPRNPYFHFQEYKPSKNPTGDSMAQLLEAMLIGQQQNNNGKPIYGAEIVGKNWTFVTLEGRSYCLSNTYDSTKHADLKTIIAILRKFKTILETELLE